MTHETPPIDDSTDTDDELASRLRENQAPEDDSSTGRRGFLGALAAGAISLAGLAGYGAGQANAQAAGSGVIGDPDPYERAHINRMVFTPRTSDPSSPDDGTLWYNSSA